MAASFFFYDLETSGFNPRLQRIMQFAGQRTDLDLNPVGEPVNIIITLTPDCLPDADAVLITGITPQQTLMDGVTEAEFLREFTDNVAIPGTIFLGYNTVRFDDEFMRFLHYRNFYDPYEWQWQDQRSRWDLLDVVRMTRALRPEGIEWPFDVHGKPTNRLELLAALNKLEHEHAHDALSDVLATISVARLIRSKQPKLFEYLLGMRDKKRVAGLVEKDEPFVYVSGRYASEFEKATAVVRICPHPERQGCAMVYDLRHDPKVWLSKTPEELAEAMRWKKDSDEPRLPVKKLQYNHCPAIAPLSVLDGASKKRLQLDPVVIKKNNDLLKASPDFADKLCKALNILEKKEQVGMVSTTQDVDASIYDGFFGYADKQIMGVVRAAAPQELGQLNLKFQDHRLEALLPLYKARNYPKALTSEEREVWDKFCYDRLMSGGRQSKLAKYFARLQEIISKGGLTGHQEYLLEELKLYAESLMPEQP
ncbi:MAG TPA: exodeoxyribonuclease I [Patescibacteria group bacterium]|nr:exodeoxyribonuclease I [Patescibacteria group bacterium]